MNLRYVLPIAVTLASVSLYAQSSPQFEVASIRPSAEQPVNSAGAGVHIAGPVVRIVALPLREYIAIAYSVRATQVIGPEWLAQTRFDVSANMPAGTSGDQFRPMLQALLADRFQIKLHRESREFPVYALAVAKGGLKVKPVAADANVPASGGVDVSGSGSGQGISLSLGGGTSFSLASNTLEAKQITMAQLADSLTRFADRTVIDRTGVTERYDIKVTLTPEEYQATLIRSAINAGIVLDPRAARLLDTAPGNPLNGPLEQAGLTLEQVKAPLDVIVVDSAARTPTEN